MQVCSRCMDQRAVVQSVYDAIRLLQVSRDNFVLLISDAAHYMTAAGWLLQQLYPRLFHVTCTAHLPHNCAEKVRAYVFDVDDLIGTMKAATVRSKDRKELFASIGYPPQPVITRWATWLKATFYYAEKLPDVRRIVESFDRNGLLVQHAKISVANSQLPFDLMVIKRDYQSLVEVLECCEGMEYTIGKLVKTCRPSPSVRIWHVSRRT